MLILPFIRKTSVGERVEIRLWHYADGAVTTAGQEFAPKLDS